MFNWTKNLSFVLHWPGWLDLLILISSLVVRNNTNNYKNEKLIKNVNLLLEPWFGINNGLRDRWAESAIEDLIPYIFLYINKRFYHHTTCSFTHLNFIKHQRAYRRGASSNARTLATTKREIERYFSFLLQHCSSHSFSFSFSKSLQAYLKKSSSHKIKTFAYSMLSTTITLIYS